MNTVPECDREPHRGSHMSYAVLWVSSGTEFEVERKLLDLGIDVYCPRVVHTSRNRKSRSIADKLVSWTKPLFPGYLFTHEDHIGIPQKAAVRGKFLMMGDKLLVLSDEQCQRIRDLELEITQELRNARPVTLELNPGDTVRVKHGALEGYSGRVVYVHKSVAKVSFKKWPIDMSIFVNNLQLA